MALKYNGEAKQLIETLPGFDLKAFEDWVLNLVLLIGSNNVLQYIEEKKRWNTKVVLISDKLFKVDFSKQALNVIKMIPDFDRGECIIWFNNSVEMSKGDILNYIEGNISNNRGN